MPKRSPRHRRTDDQRPDPRSGTQRLQRILASAGFGSRRQCEELIEEGRVSVDGELASLGQSADPTTADIRVDDSPIRPNKLVYYAVHKPTGVVTTNRDPQGRPRVIDLVPPTERVFPVGRLDMSSEGLILLTNDGDLAQKLAHPRFGVRKVYRVTVAGKVDGETMKQMRQGIYISEGFVKVEGAKILKARPRATELEIILREGKNREIRRILARLGHKVQTLRRIAIGPLRLGDMPAAAHRKLTREEIAKLRDLVSRPQSESKPKRTKRRTSNPKRAQKSAGVSNRVSRPVKGKRRTTTGNSLAGLSPRGPNAGTVIGADGDAPVVKTKTARKKPNRKRR